jgi:class 3 adenylate cyclase
MTTVDLSDLLQVLDDRVKDEIASKPSVEDVGHDLDIKDLPIEARKWLKVTDVVAVVADLKNSTLLGTGKHAASTASIYEASTGSVVSIFDKFEADFLAIQGDGVFALFWGDNRVQRAMCAGITIQTFSKDSLIERLEDKWPDGVKTGYKIGVARSRVLVKRVGTPRNLAQQEPIWAGRAVNFATKAAQSADRGQLVVTGDVWDSIEKNDYVALSCPCGGSEGSGPSDTIWDDFTIDRLPDDEPDRLGRVLTSQWCPAHGAEYCTAILNGEKRRDDVTEARKVLESKHRDESLFAIHQRRRRDRRAHLRGLT